jgi:hypothetical protein
VKLLKAHKLGVIMEDIRKQWCFVSFKKVENEMTDIKNETSYDDVWRQWAAERAHRGELAVGVNAHNREGLFAILRAAGVRTVIVDFDGCGDEGQIERIDAYTGVQGEGPIQLPETPVTI